MSNVLKIGVSWTGQYKKCEQYDLEFISEYSENEYFIFEWKSCVYFKLAQTLFFYRNVFLIVVKDDERNKYTWNTTLKINKFWLPLLKKLIKLKIDGEHVSGL